MTFNAIENNSGPAKEKRAHYKRKREINEHYNQSYIHKSDNQLTVTPFRNDKYARINCMQCFMCRFLFYFILLFSEYSFSLWQLTDIIKYIQQIFFI